MAWFKVDDGFYTSQKVMRIPRSIRNEAVGAWILIGTWSADKMTDGVIPHWVIDDFGVSAEVITALLECGLWFDNGDGVTYHDWCEYQPTKAQLEAKSRNRAVAGSVGGKRSGEVRRNKAEAKLKQNEANANPEPEPVPLITKVINTRATRINDNWNLDESLMAWTKTTAPNLNIQFEREKFIDYWLSKSGKDSTKTDWARTWKNWVRSNVERNPGLAIVVESPKRKITGYAD